MDEISDKSIENLRESLDNWSTKTTKNKRKKKKGKENDDNPKEQGDGFTADVEVLGKFHFSWRIFFTFLVGATVDS